MTVNLYLIRHGEAESNIANHAAQNGDMSLAELLAAKSPSEYRLTGNGIKQAVEIGSLFRNEGIEFTECTASPMLRAVETALIATESSNPGDAPVIDELLTERSWGVHERTVTPLEEHEALWRSRTHYTNLDWHPTDGDSYLSTLLRARMILEKYFFVYSRHTSLGYPEVDIHVGLFVHAEILWFLERVLRGDTNLNDPGVPLPDVYVHNCAVRHWQAVPHSHMRMRSNSKVDLTHFGQWTDVKPVRPLRTELYKMIERSQPVIF